MLDRLETVLDFIDKMKDQIILMGDLNINFLKSDKNKEKLEVLLNMFGLQAVINEPTRLHKKTKSAIDQIILNLELWGFKTKVLETSLSDHFGQILQIDHDSLQ
jgi:endonuclease/exonuclease/phosphatase family metal-dependent hydrolase